VGWAIFGHFRPIFGRFSIITHLWAILEKSPGTSDPNSKNRPQVGDFSEGDFQEGDF